MRDLQSQVDQITLKLDVANINIERVEKENRALLRSDKTLQHCNKDYNGKNNCF